MATTDVRAPSGEVFSINHPEGATQAEILGYAKANFTNNVKAHDGAEKFKRQASEDGGFTNAAAAFGGALPEAMRLGVKGIFGGNKPGEVQEWKDSMSGLTSTLGGKIGAFTGGAAPAAALAMAPGGQTVLGSLIGGGALGAAQPAETGSERTRNVTMGGLTNAAFPAALALGKTGSAFVAPMTQGGNERIAGRVLNRFATDPAAVASARGGRSASGAFPTLAEETGDLGVANLQGILQNRDPRNLIAGRFSENNAARVNALTNLGGTDDQLSRALARRKSIGGAAYDRANTEGVDTAMATAMKPQIDNLLERPAVKKAIDAAKNKAANEGIALSELGSPTGLKYLKQELDDIAIGFQPGSNDRRIYSQLSKDVDSVMREIAPGVKQADKVYARLSREPNRMEVARELRDAATGTIRDFDGNVSMTAQKLTNALDRRSPKIVSDALGRRTERSIEDVMSPAQMGVIDDVRTGVERQSSAVKNRSNGSQTARNLIGDDIIGQIAGPLGVPKSFAQSVAAQNFLSRPLSFVLRTPEERLNETLLRTMLDPAYASQVVGRANPSALALRGQGLLQNTSPLIQGGLLGGSPLLLESRQ